MNSIALRERSIAFAFPASIQTSENPFFVEKNTQEKNPEFAQPPSPTTYTYDCYIKQKRGSSQA